MSRREILQSGLAAGGAAAGLSINRNAMAQLVETNQKTLQPKTNPKGFWPDGIRMPISISLMFESGAQPRFGAHSPLVRWAPPDGIYDLPTITWYRYGVTEGIPRALEMFDRLKVSVTSHMAGEAVKNYPSTAKSIVQAGHEAAAHGWDWSTQSAMTEEQERESISKNVDIIKEVTGQRAIGFNAPGLRASKHILFNLVALGFKYHIDDLSRDEPFIVQIDKKSEIAVVPYTINLNDIFAYEGHYYSSSQLQDTMKSSFDQLYEEAGSRRRMMSIAIHDRLMRPEHARTMEEFMRYVQQKQGVSFMKKTDIADYILKAKNAVREPIGIVYPTIPGLYRGAGAAQAGP